MFKNAPQFSYSIISAVAIVLFSSFDAEAKKPPKPPKPGDDDPVAYTLVELSAIHGWASAVNQLDGGVEVIGRLFQYSREEQVGVAHYWMLDAAGNVLVSQELQTLPPAEPDAIVSSAAYDVSNQGVLVGYQRDGSAAPRPLLWPDAASAPIELPMPEGAIGAYASSVNDAGIVVGTTYNSEDQSFLAWRVSIVDGVAMVLDTRTILSAASLLSAKIVNSGYVAQSVASELGNYRAFRLKLDWNDEQVWEVVGSRTQLFDVYSQAIGINEAGTVCGKYNDGASWAFVMNVDGELLELPELPGGRIRGQRYIIRNMSANALNNAASTQVVGDGVIRIVDTGEARGTLGVLWTIGGAALDMRPVANGERTYLHDINDAGWIVGDTVDPEDATVRLPVVLIPGQ